MFKLIKLLLLVIFLLLGASFAVMNDTLVALDLYFITLDLPLSLVLLSAVGIGIILGALASMLFFLKRQARLAD